MVDIAAAVATIKTIAGVAQQAGRIDLTQQVIDLQQTLLAIVGQNAQLTDELSRLQTENRRLREEADEKLRLRFERECYWRIEGEAKEGPFCSRCFDVERKLVRLHASYNGYFNCLNCEKVVCVYPEQGNSDRHRTRERCLTGSAFLPNRVCS